MRFGLSDAHIQKILSSIQRYPQVEEIRIYGSRAKGNFKPGSVVDISLKGDLSLDVLSKIQYHLNEETTLPYFFDITHYDTLTNASLKDHIDRVGKVLNE